MAARRRHPARAPHLTTAPPVHVFHITDTRMERAGVGSVTAWPRPQRHDRGARASAARRPCGRRWTSDGCCGGTTHWRRSTASCASAYLTTSWPPRSRASGATAAYASCGRSCRWATAGPSRRASRRCGCTGTTLDCRGRSSSTGCTTTRACGRYRLDIGLPELRYAAEYDGEEFHTLTHGPRARRERRACARDARHWHFEVFTKTDVYDRGAPRSAAPVGSRSAAERSASGRRSIAVIELPGRAG